MEENKKNYKIGLLPLILLILDIVLIIVVIIMGIIIHIQQKEIDSVSNKSIQSSQVEAENKEDLATTNEISNSISSNKNQDLNVVKENVSNTISNDTSNEYAAKIVENRPYIYDAQYLPNGLKVTNYSTNDGSSYSTSDIVVPYVNMVSNDASQMNTEIENLYNDYIEEFRICSQNLNSYIKVNYNSYITSNIYSIVITIYRGQEEKETVEYIAYNFDIMSGTKLDYNQVCYIAGINNASESIQKTLNNLEDYNKYKLTVNRDVTQSMVDDRNAQIDSCQTQVYTLYQENLLNNKLTYYLDNNLKLNVVLKIILPEENTTYEKIVIVEN